MDVRPRSYLRCIVDCSIGFVVDVLSQGYLPTLSVKGRAGTISNAHQAADHAPTVENDPEKSNVSSLRSLVWVRHHNLSLSTP
jgi:hypothetical protein